MSPESSATVRRKICGGKNFRAVWVLCYDCPRRSGSSCRLLFRAVLVPPFLRFHAACCEKLVCWLPLKGLHRESGYAALSAMRTALADFPLKKVEAVPLALDTSADPAQARRAAAKMLRDDTVVAVVGPLQARQVSAVADVFTASGVEWRPQGRPPSNEAGPKP